MKKRLLVIGAGFLQTFLIKRAKALGFEVICVDKDKDAIGFQFADRFKSIDIVDSKLCLKFAQEENIDGVVTAATDYGVLTTSYIAQEMNLFGLDYKSAKLIKNKVRIRKKLFEDRIDDFNFFMEVKEDYDLDVLKQTTLFPVMVKPVDGSGSKGAIRVDTVETLNNALKFAITNSITKTAVIEQFIEGVEYGVESFVVNGEVRMMEIIGKEMTQPPNYAELGHHFPSNINQEIKVKETIKKAIKALGVDNGSLNMDILVDEEGKVYIVDVGARMGGNLIGSHIIPIATGIPYLDNLIYASVGEFHKLSFAVKDERNVVTRILAMEEGKVKRLPNFKKISEEFNINIFPNFPKEIRSYKNNLDGCGYILKYSSSDLSVLKKEVEEVKSMINEMIERSE